MKKIIQYKDYPPMTYYLSSWFPFFLQGFSLGFWNCVKYVYYKNTKVICVEETEDVIKHEYSHFVLYKTKYKYLLKYLWAYIGWKGMMLFFPHSVFPFEYEANKIKATLWNYLQQYFLWFYFLLLER